VPHPLRRLALAAALLILAAACATRGGGSRSADAVVFFVNNSLNQASVYAINTGGTQTRIGTVFPGRRERLRLPGTILGGSRTFELQARQLTSSRVPRSGPITLIPGDSIEVTLSSDGALLSVLPLRGRDGD
jgi:hypothetical protein